MSTILKALRRLEDDQKARDHRSLRERVLSGEAMPQPDGQGGRSFGAYLAGGLAILVVLGAAAFWILYEAQTAANIFLPQPTERASTAALASPARNETAPPAARITVVRPPLPNVSTPPPGSSRALERTVTPVDVPAAPPQDAPGIAEDIVQIVRPGQVASADSVVVAKEPVRKVAVAKSADPKPQRKKAPPIRRVERAPMPEFVVTQTVWHPAASRRVAMIRLKGQAAARSYSEGDDLGSLELVEIQPAAVVFHRDGVKIKRSIGR